MSPDAHDDQQRLSGRLRLAAKAWPQDAPAGLGERLAARVAAATAGGRADRAPLTMPARRWLAVAAGLLIALGALAIAHGAPAAAVAPLAIQQPQAAPDPFALPLPALPSETPLSIELRNLDADMRATAEFLVDRLPRIALAQREGGGKGQP